MNVRKLVIGLLLVAALPAGWFAWQWKTTPVPPEVPLTGVDELVAAAVRSAVQAVEKQPRSGAAWGKLAMVLVANGFDADAPRCYDEAARWEPANPAWPYLRGMHRLEVDPAEAMPFLVKALSLTSDFGEKAAIHFQLGQALLEDGQLAEAERHVQALRRMEPDGPRTQFLLGLLALARADRESARKHLSTLTATPFIQKRACTLLAGLVDDKEQARKLQERAERLPTDQAWPDPFIQEMKGHYVNRMKRLTPYMMLDSQGRQQEALMFLRRLVAESPDGEVCFFLGLALYKMNEFEEAEKMLEAALRYEPTNVKSQFFIASSLLQRAERKYQEPSGKDAALELFRRTVAAADKTLVLKSEHGAAHQVRGWALKYLGRRDEALAALRQAVLIQPETSDMHMQLGEALAEAGQMKEALEHLQHAVKFASPGDPRPMQALEKARAKVKMR